MPKQKLFDDNSDEEVGFKFENEYAKKYDVWREKEEYHKLEQKYGAKALNSDASSSSDSEDESDEPPEISEETETQFLKTLALLKTKDPRIYDPSYKFFDEEKEKEPEKETKVKSLTFADSDEDDDGGDIFSIEKKAEINNDSKTLAKDDVKIKKNVKEDKLKDYLTGRAEHIDDDVEKELAPLKELWSDPKLNDGEAFLRDYILNKSYLDDGDADETVDKIRDDEELEDDEKIVEEQGKFERAYNFRFEEPDEEYIKRFPRTMNYIRPKDDRRSRKRAELRTRKEEEKRRKMEEIGRLKALKLKEIQEKIAKIKEVTGNQDLAFEDVDIQGDFDPEEHDRRMKAIFDEQYYGDVDEEKPVFPDLDEELEIENWDNYNPDDQHKWNGEELHCEDEDFIMDADYDPKKVRMNLIEEIKSNLHKKRRNRKKKSKLAELLASKKPKFVPTVADRTYTQYMEEYYKMDCEDIIGGDLPTRFKYREVVPNDYGLTVEEILLADDKELNQWVPLKSVVKHRPENMEKGDVKTFAKKAADLNLKKKVLPSLFKDLPQEPEIVEPVQEGTKKKKKNNKNDTENVNAEENVSNDLENENEKTELTPKKKKKKSKTKTEIQMIESDIQACTEENIEIKDDNINSDKESGPNNNDILLEKEDKKVGERKKKKKKKHNGFIVEDLNKEEPSKNSSIVTKINTENNKSTNQNTNNLKRKLETNLEETQVPKKKKKKKNKDGKSMANNIQEQNVSKRDFKTKSKQNDKFKNKDNQTDNPLSKLSDERLKAYGLNPKKYRSFLKYKKF